MSPYVIEPIIIEIAKIKYDMILTLYNEGFITDDEFIKNITELDNCLNKT